MPMPPNVHRVGGDPADRRDASLLRNPGRIGSVPVNLVLGQRGKIFD